MNKYPSYKIAVVLSAVYTILLFLPTIDIAGIFNLSVFGLIFAINSSALIFPMIYPMADSVTEVYGKKPCYYMVISCYAVIVSFSLLNNIMISKTATHHLYDFLTKPSLLITLIGPVGYIVTSFINIRFLSKLKMVMRGRHFLLRSFVCSSISEIIISLIIYPIVFYNKSWNFILSVGGGTTLIKVLMTIPMVFVAKFLVFLYRYFDGIERLPYSQDFAAINRQQTI